VLRSVCMIPLLGLVSCPLSAIVIASGDPNAQPAVVVYSDEVVNAIGQTVNLSGVVELETSDGLGCTGSLLPDGYSILTAAHCITSYYGSSVPSSVSVYFLGQSGSVEDTSTTYYVDPNWTGNSTVGGDLAVLRLQQAAPSSAARYSLYTGISTTSPILLAGYGYSGTGTTGADSSTYGFGTLRQGQNRYDYTGDALGWSANLLVGDFDNGTTTYNALGTTDSDIPDEVDLSFGDSGGPSFYDGEIIGVHDFIDCSMDADGNCLIPPSGHSYSTSDNSYFGQIFADTSVSAYASWIDGEELQAPEPTSCSLVLLGLAVTGFLRSRTSRRPS